MLGAIPGAWAWDGNQSFVPWQIDVTDGANYGFRVWGVSCTGGMAAFGYLNSTDSNYSTYVSVILMAKAQGSTVTFYTNLDANGFCHIGYIGQL
jgi:hypothetical protein